MALQDYFRLAVFYKGNALNQVTSIGLTTNSGQQRIDLLNEGLGGFTPGSGDCTIDIGYVVPLGGTEDTFQEDCASGAYVTLQIPIGAKSYIGRGKILTNTVTQSTNASVEGTFSWTGELKAID